MSYWLLPGEVGLETDLCAESLCGMPRKAAPLWEGWVVRVVRPGRS